MPAKTKKRKIRTKLRKARYYFFLNPSDEMAFTRCPKCEQKTRVRKHCLFINIDPQFLLTLNKTCKYCPWCDLIILKQTDLEAQLRDICEEYAPDSVGDEYLVLGTMDRKDWKEGQSGEMMSQEAIKRFYPFKDVWKFEIIPGGWYPEKR